MGISDEERERIAAVFAGECMKTHCCPIKDIISRYGDKWSMLAVLLLGKNKKMRFNELRCAVNGISQRMLTVTLRALQEDGLVTRTIYPEIPPRVEYALTELGESLLKQLLQLARWADDNFAAILEARRAWEQQLKQAEPVEE